MPYTWMYPINRYTHIAYGCGWGARKNPAADFLLLSVQSPFGAHNVARNPYKCYQIFVRQLMKNMNGALHWIDEKFGHISMPWHMSISALARGADGSTNTNVYLTAVRNNNTVVTMSAHTHTHTMNQMKCVSWNQRANPSSFFKKTISTSTVGAWLALPISFHSPIHSTMDEMVLKWKWRIFKSTIY